MNTQPSLPLANIRISVANSTKKRLTIRIAETELDRIAYAEDSAEKETDMTKQQLSDRRTAELNKKNLARANLSRQKLGGANLARANLRGANLSDADLVCANLAEANLMEANLSNANLVDARMGRAKLTGADFAKADVNGANFRNTDLSAVKNLTMQQIRSAKVDESTKLPRTFKAKMPKIGRY
jgi:uncharacterized protein YjbI with pentapeptide repeats